MKRLPRDVKACLEKARESALLAVGCYNRPETAFRSGAYIVLMVIAWTSLFHAVFLRDRVKPFYTRIRTKRYVRYKKVDGDKKAWELKECLRQFYKDENPPARRNLEFFIGLRNKIEHRNMPHLDDRIFGECQALLLNFEALLSEEFGDQYALNESLTVSLQFSTVVPRKKLEALRSLQSKSYSSVMDYVERFRSGLSTDTEQSMEYSFRVFLIPKPANRAKSSDAAVEFIKPEDLNDELRSEYERFVTLIKTRETPVAHPGEMKPGDVVRKVEAKLGYRFRINDHTVCWKFYQVRPATNATAPTITNPRFCQYDKPHKDYIYTDEWVEFLVKNLSVPSTYVEILGKEPHPIGIEEN